MIMAAGPQLRRVEADALVATAKQAIGDTRLAANGGLDGGDGISMALTDGDHPASLWAALLAAS